MSAPQIYFQLPVGLCDEMIWPDYPVEALAALNAGLAGGLAQEPAQGGGPITRFIGYKLLGKPRCTRSEAQAMLPLQPGDPSPFFDPVDDIRRANQTKLDRTYASPLDIATCGPTDRPDWLEIGRIVLLALAGGRAFWIEEACALPVYFVLDSIDDPCPLSVPAAGEEQETWQTWGVWGESHKPEQIGGKWYRSSAVGQSGANVTIDTWLPLYMAGELVVITREQFAAVPRPQPQIEQ